MFLLRHVYTTTSKRPVAPIPRVMKRCSPGSDSSSVIVIAYGSSKTGIASGNRTPCFRKFSPAFPSSSHSNPTSQLYAQVVHTATSALRQPRPHQQRIRVRLPPHKLAIQLRRVLAVALRQNILPERRANGPAEDPLIAEPCKCVGVQHLGPLIRVVTRAVSHRTGEQVREARDHRILRR